MTSENLRVAVVGAGGWGAQHVRVFSGRPDTELVAVVGRDPDRTGAIAEATGANGYVDVDRMMSEQRPDLVSVSLPNEEHFDTTMRLLEYGVPLMLEKPLVFDLAEADAIVENAHAKQTFVAVDFNHRYAEPVVRATRAAHDGTLGDLTFATWRFGGEANKGPSPHKNIIETQCHGFDMLEHIVGPITSVTAQMTNKTYGAWSTVAMTLGFANGAVGTLLGSYDSSYAYPDTHRLEINGTVGRAVVHDTVASIEIAKSGDETTNVWRAGYFNDTDRGFHATIDRYVDDMLRALRAGEAPPVPVTAGRRALRLACRAIEAHETGRRANVEADDAPTDWV